MDTKPGWKTTEFWMTMAAMFMANFGPVAQQVADAAGPNTSLWTTAALGAAYTVVRGYTKSK